MTRQKWCIVQPDGNKIEVYSGEIKIKRIQRGDCFYDVTHIKKITNGNIGQRISSHAKSIGNSNNSVGQNTRIVNSKLSVDVDYLDAVADAEKTGVWSKVAKMVKEYAASKGYDQIRYHQTYEKFIKEFDIENGVNTEMERLFPFGVFTKSNLRDIGLLGKNQLEYFVKTGKMLRVKDRDDLISKLPSEYKDYLSKIDELASYYTPLIEQLEDEYFEALDRYLEENPDFQERYAELSYEEGEALLKTVNDPDFVNASNKYNNAMAEWIKKDAAISKEARHFVTQWLKENGYDSVEVDNDVGSYGRTTDATILSV